jgi:alkenylglycerophosphocholine hydrolase
MLIALSAAAFVCAVLAIAADREQGRHPAFYALKPLTTLFIVALALFTPTVAPVYQQWIVAALLLSLAGDISLMFSGNRWFLGGLGSFLLAHLAFVAAFLQGVTEPAPPWWAWAVLPAAAAMLVVLLPKAGRLKLPVVLYCLVLTAMVLAAAARYAEFPGMLAQSALVGAVLFLLSDALLGWRKFAGPFPGAQAAILSTYWMAIWLIALSV